MKRFGQNLLLIFLSSLFALLIGEAAIRLFVPGDRWQFRDASSDWQPDSLLGWKQKENYNAVNYDYGLEPVVFRTNADGFRPHTSTPKTIDTADFVVFLVGNSTVNSRMVPEDQTIHFYLDSLLSLSGKNAMIVNASVQGYSTDQALLMITRYAKRYKPDWIVYGFCDNDLGGIMNHEAYALQKPKFDINGDSLRLIPIAHYNENFDRFRSWTWKDLIVKSAMYRLIKPILVTMEARTQDASKRILIGAGGAAYYFEPAGLDVFDWKLLDALLREMKAESEKMHAKFAYYAHPALESVWLPHIEAAEKLSNQKIHPFVIEERLEEIAKREEILFIPMAAYFRSKQNEGPFHLLPKDTHCNGNGYRLQSMCIAPVLLKGSIIL